MADGSGAAAPAALPEFDVHCSATTWGPPSEIQFHQFDKVPFRLFNRGAKIGKAADFGGFLRPQMRGRFARAQGEQHSELDLRAEGGAEDDGAGAFVRVDGTKTVARQRPGGQRRQQQQIQRAAQVRGEERETAQRGARMVTGTSFNKRFNKLTKARYLSDTTHRNKAGGMGRPMREFSVKVQPDWLQLEVVEMAKLKELSLPGPAPAGTDLKWTGLLEAYDEDYDRVISRVPRKLKRFENCHFFFKTAQDDPLLGEYATEGENRVVATDAVLSHLMTCTRSVYPWDIVATYVNGVVILDVRDPLEFELQTVNETSNMPPGESDMHDPNHRVQLSIEATTIHENFTQQVLAANNGKAPEPRSAKEVVPEANPLWDPAAAAAEAAAEAAEVGEDPATKAPKTPAAVAFRYRQWNVSKDITLVARTTVHAVLRKKAGAGGAAASAAPPPPQYLQVYTVNEWDPKLAGTTEWKQLIDSQRGNVLSTEIKNNNFKMAKFTASALLAGVDSMRLGFVSRQARADAENHQIMATHALAPVTFAQQLQLAPSNMWAILKWLVELVRKHARNLQEDTPDEEYMAKFVLLRDPGEGKVHFYSVPTDAFDGEEAASEGEEAGWTGDVDDEEAA